jgi:hypothetical protein
MMHRAPLAQMAKVTGDPVGPGMATQTFRAGDPTRLGVVTVFEKEPKLQPPPARALPPARSPPLSVQPVVGVRRPPRLATMPPRRCRKHA